MSKTIAIGSDHRGVALKSEIAGFLMSKGHTVKDFGAHTSESVDYPDYAIKVARSVSEGTTDCGIVICHSGVGVSVSANKVKGIRAALCHNAEQSSLSKKHNNANVLAIPAGFVKVKDAKEIVKCWIESKFEGGRHEKRINKISDFENGETIKS
jgi:ribose 5-phosphate isomerase B